MIGSTSFMTSSLGMRVLAAYRSSRKAGHDEWSACEAALEVVRRAHPEASADFANTFVSDVLREAYPPERIRAAAARPRAAAVPPARRSGRDLRPSDKIHFRRLPAARATSGATPDLPR